MRQVCEGGATLVSVGSTKKKSEQGIRLQELSLMRVSEIEVDDWVIGSELPANNVLPQKSNISAIIAKKCLFIRVIPCMLIK